MKFAKMNDALFTALNKEDAVNILGGKRAFTSGITSCEVTNVQTNGSGADSVADCADVDCD